MNIFCNYDEMVLQIDEVCELVNLAKSAYIY